MPYSPSLSYTWREKIRKKTQKMKKKKVKIEKREKEMRKKRIFAEILFIFYALLSF